jgi:hypothetical protein
LQRCSSAAHGSQAGASQCASAGLGAKPDQEAELPVRLVRSYTVVPPTVFEVNVLAIQVVMLLMPTPAPGPPPGPPPAGCALDVVGADEVVVAALDAELELELALEVELEVVVLARDEVAVAFFAVAAVFAADVFFAATVFRVAATVEVALVAVAPVRRVMCRTRRCPL